MRMIAKDICVKRPDQSFSIYKMSNHKASEKNPVREKMLFTSVIRMNKDGLNNLNKQNISVVSVKKKALYTLLTINVGRRSEDFFDKFEK